MKPHKLIINNIIKWVKNIYTQVIDLNIGQSYFGKQKDTVTTPLIKGIIENNEIESAISFAEIAVAKILSI